MYNAPSTHFLCSGPATNSLFRSNPIMVCHAPRTECVKPGLKDPWVWHRFKGPSVECPFASHRTLHKEATPFHWASKPIAQSLIPPPH